MQRPRKRLRTSRSLVFGRETRSEFEQQPSGELEDVFQNNQNILPGLDRTFEALFDKYANMPEDIADVVDLESETIVVDNGHLRGLQQNPETWERAQMLDGIVTGNGWDLEDDSKDELAPSRSPSPIPIQRTQAPVEPAPVEAAPQPEPIVEQANIEAPPAINEAQFSDAFRQLSGGQQLESTPSGQQNGVDLLKIIQQFVDQSVAQRLQQQPIVPNPSTGPLDIGTLSTPVAHSSETWRDPVPPAKDPKWYFPPLPRPASTTRPTATTSVPRRKRVFPSSPRTNRRREPAERGEQSIFPTPKRTSRALSSPIVRIIQRKTAQVASAAYQSPVPATKGPEDTILVEEEAEEAEEAEEEEGISGEAGDTQSSPIRELPLSTPSLIYSDGTESQRDIGDGEAVQPEHAHLPVTFFEENLELLPMAEDKSNRGNIMDDVKTTPTEEIPLIVASIESDDVYEPQPRNSTQDSTSSHVQVAIPVRSPPQPQAQRAPVICDSPEIDLVSNDEAQKPDMIATPPPLHDGDLPDELDAPCPSTPVIKRESLTPGPSSLLRAVPPATPKSAPQPHRADSSTVKATPKLSKSQLSRLARAQWAKQGRSGTPQTSKPKKRLASPQKKRWVEESEDELA